MIVSTSGSEEMHRVPFANTPCHRNDTDTRDFVAMLFSTILTESILYGNDVRGDTIFTAIHIVLE